LATIACSNEIFVPSAKLVTMYGSWPHFSANACCVVGRAVLVLQALDVAADQRGEADALHEPDQVQLDARLVAVAAAQHHSGRVGLAFRTCRRCRPLGVQQHHVLAAGDRGGHHVRAELDVPGGLDDRVDCSASRPPRSSR
jgi:hypothetical protein